MLPLFSVGCTRTPVPNVNKERKKEKNPRSQHILTRDSMGDFQVSIIEPCPVESSPLPDRFVLIAFDIFVPSTALCQFNNSGFHSSALFPQRRRRSRPIFRPKSGCFIEPVTTDDTADLGGCMWDMIYKTFRSASLNEVRYFFLQTII